MSQVILDSWTLEELHKLLKDPQIIALFLTAGLEVLRRIFQPKASIIWGISHGFAFAVPQTQGGQMLLQTRSIVVKNAGRAAAKDVEFYFNYKPEHFQVWPVIQFTTEMTADGRFLVKIPFLKPGENFSIELIHSHTDTPSLVNVRAVEGKCKEVNMAPMQIFPFWFNASAAVLFLIGVYQSLVWIVRILQ